MNRFTRLLLNYLMYALPFVIAVMVWGSLRNRSEVETHPSFLVRAAWEVGGWNLMIWFALLLVLLLTLVTSPSAREQTLRKIANLRDRDEREELFTGRAARSSYISTLSLLILLLFVSIFQFNVERHPPNALPNGKRGTMSLTLSFSLFDEPRQSPSQAAQTDVVIESRGIPFSKSAVILGVLLWLVISFNLSMRRQMKTEE